MEKGFTLIELLAVIVILAIILLISVPLISNVILSVKKSGFESSIKSIIKGAGQEQIIRQFKGDNREVTYTFDEYNQTVIPSDIEELKFSGKGPKFGTITVSSTGKIEVQVTDGEYYIETDGSGKLKETVAYVGPVEPTESLIYKNRSIAYAYESATTKLAVDSDDDGFGTINLGFDFNFGGTNGNTYSTIYPSTNGYIAFTEENATDYDNQVIVSRFEYPIIAPYWTDLVFDTDLNPSVGIYYTIGVEGGQDYILIEWRTVNDYNSNNQDETTTGDFEVKLYEDGTIKTYYQDVEFEGVDYSNGRDSTIGVFVTGANYNNFSHATDSVTSGSAIEYYLTPGTMFVGCFAFEPGTGTIEDYDQTCTKDVVIPTTIDDIAVTRIGATAFFKSQLTSVIIPNGVTYIGSSAFSSNLIVNLNLPNGVTHIGEYAFSNNQLTSINIPSSVIEISDSAFRDNQLASVIIQEGVTRISDNAFDSNQLTSVNIPSSVKYLSGFENNQLTNIIIPNTVSEIGLTAFLQNQLVSVILPEGITRIDEYSFSWNKLTSINIPNSVTYLSGFKGNQITDITVPNSVIEIGSDAFRYNQITNVTIPNSVITIGSSSFSENRITSVLIPNGVVTIGGYAFGSNLLTSVTIPNSVTTIEREAFTFNNITQGNAQIDNTLGNGYISSDAFINNGFDHSITVTPTYLR